MKKKPELICTPLSYSLPKWVHDKLAELAARDGRSASNLLTQIVYSYLEKNKSDGK